MPRPLRRLYPPASARRRHRTWMLSMTLATAALGVLGLTVVLMKVAPEHAPRLRTAWWLAQLFAWPGLLLGLLTIRAKRSWLLFAAVPLLANGMLILLPWLVMELRKS